MQWSGAPKTEYIAKVVDALLKADKSLDGEPPPWVEGNRRTEKRLLWPVAVDGSYIGLSLQITAYPNDPGYRGERFTITLNVPPCIWRMDFDPPYKRHTNPPDFGARTGTFTVSGKSFHSWADNRHYATKTRLPTVLGCARLLPPEVRHFRQALRWFCDETNSKILSEQMFDYPQRELML